MECPRCNKPLAVLEFEKIEIDYCIACQGIWLDSGELELLLNSNTKIVFNSLKSIGEKPLRCPRCRKKMEKMREAPDGPLLDRCRQDHGVWFDRGELESVLESGKIGTDNRIIEHLRGIFREKAKSIDTGERK